MRKFRTNNVVSSVAKSPWTSNSKMDFSKSLLKKWNLDMDSSLFDGLFATLVESYVDLRTVPSLILLNFSSVIFRETI